MKDLIKRGIEVPIDDFYLVEPELFAVLYDIKDKPDFVSAFIGISLWMGTSLRSGVWTYYEAADPKEIELITMYLQQCAPNNEIVRLYALGNHDYGNEKYQVDFNYPEEWLEESKTIDKWIFDNERIIIGFMQEILRNNRGYFDSLFYQLLDKKRIRSGT